MFACVCTYAYAMCMGMCVCRCNIVYVCDYISEYVYILVNKQRTCPNTKFTAKLSVLCVFVKNTPYMCVFTKVC